MHIKTLMRYLYLVISSLRCIRSASNGAEIYLLFPGFQKVVNAPRRLTGFGATNITTILE